MECPECRFENRQGAKFCRECGHTFDRSCPECGTDIVSGSKFCDECGHPFESEKETSGKILKAASRPLPPAPQQALSDVAPLDGERKHVTVLFSDLSGYTAMSEKLDPEEVKEMMSRIFGEVAQVIARYEGFIEKFIGDAVMALFGVPKAHEDDPIRAIRVAREIHERVTALSPEIEKRTGQPVSMHSGVNTGLVVTGEVDLEKGTHGIAGDTINLASRLCSLGAAGDILVGPDTYHQAQGYFTFEALEPTRVKGKEKPVQIYKVIAPKSKPVTIHRLSGVRAELIGRKVEIAELGDAVKNLQAGRGRIFSICGTAGTGKSRLVEDFKATLDLEDIQWLEGRAYAYAQNIPYFPLIDLLSRVFGIEEGDAPDRVRQKIESGVGGLVDKKESVIPYVGSLYSLPCPQIDSVSPEFWKSRLCDAVKMIISALARKAPTIFLLEDLHWADPSFAEFLRNTLLEMRQPAIVLCVYRPVFSLFTAHQSSGLADIYQEIRLKDLSSAESQDMLESLLKAKEIPADLRRFVQDKTEGNPFYLEELINSLIETEMLKQDDASWRLTKSITESDISATVQGVIAGRLDRLEKESKRILQEAAVIGRAFLYDILKKVTALEAECDTCLSSLERLDLIRTRSFQPDMEYVFKHALAQEVVYNGILKKERREIHERIALVMENLFGDRLQEFYETLAFHFARGQSVTKAVDYLIKSGGKSLNRFALDEAQQYYQQAYQLLSARLDAGEENKNLLFDLLEKWALVYYYHGAFIDMVDLLRTHEATAESLQDKGRRGIFYAWLGMALWGAGKHKESYNYLKTALKLGEETGDLRVMGFATAWLPLACVERGLIKEGIEYGQRAVKICSKLPEEQYLNFKAQGDLGYLYYFVGDSGKTLAAGKTMVEYGEKHANIRSQAMGHAVLGWGYLAAGDLQKATEKFKQTEQIAMDPFYATVWSMFRSLAHFLSGQIEEAESALALSEQCQKAGFAYAKPFHRLGMGLVLIAKGRIGKGINLLLEARQTCLDNEFKCSYALSEYILGKVYLGIALGEGDVNMSTMVKNVGFLMKTIPFAARKAASHLTTAIAAAREIGAEGTEASAHLDLGKLHHAKGRTEQAREHLSQAVELFERCRAEIYLKKAKETLDALR